MYSRLLVSNQQPSVMLYVGVIEILDILLLPMCRLLIEESSKQNIKSAAQTCCQTPVLPKGGLLESGLETGGEVTVLLMKPVWVMEHDPAGRTH